MIADMVITTETTDTTERLTVEDYRAYTNTA